MPDDMGLSLDALIARRRPGYSLEAPFYTSRAVFDLDLDLIFGRHWIYVGVEPDVPEPGDCMTVDIGLNSVVIARDDDMGIRAFHNVCRHRGAKLVHDPKATVGNLVCRYHQWTYGLDGRLLYAEHMAEDFDRACFGLKPVHVRSMAGLLFICLAAEPPADFELMAQELTPYIAPHDLPNCKVIKEVELIEHGNWKLTMENNRECYHCSVSHPELTISLFAEGYGFVPDPDNAELVANADRYDALVAEMQGKWTASGFPAREVEHLADRVTGYRTERLPLDGAGESQTVDTKAASRKLLGSFTDARLGGLSVWTQPNSWHHFMSDHIVTFSAIPLDPERTLLRTKWLVHKDAVEGVDYDIDNVTAVWEATNRQDGELVGMAQAGARTTGYEQGPYSTYTEGLVEKFSRWYIGRLAAHRGL
jgi:Rieske 2Fe-2S family protein